ncbi:hypothetical protein [Peribacillus sp. SI8-4]|uniref:hypothetical protein n=1 Tax=Peribacillus sp. SI8-4 TaxID=3048009 RepID=UPI002556DF3C|nr:hypothetical protein [Peribacillus sp. SI8-4]
MGKEYRVSIATLTDYHLQDFIRCPYQFYFHHIEGKSAAHQNWRKMIQFVINQVVSRYYKLPPESQTNEKVKELIDEYWRVIDVRQFESKIQYYMTLANITEHLSQFLTAGKNEYPPLFLYEKLNMNIDELGTDLSLTLEVAEWSSNSFIIKKYLVDTTEDMNVLFIHLISVFCQMAFGQLPDRIEIISLMDGNLKTHIPTEKDVSNGLKYLNIIKNLLKEPKNYIKTDCATVCNSCSYQKRCFEGIHMNHESIIMQ